MTIGENIWKRSIEQINWETFEQQRFATLGKIVIAAIDEAFNDLERDHLAEIIAMEADRC